jgi:hypothetical protein
MLVLAWAALLLAALPAAMIAKNLRAYRPAPGAPGNAPGVSILIPARDEEAAIGEAVRCALASGGKELEVVVLDDHSTDRTAEIVAALAAKDPRVRLESAPPLPPGWNGKQHACAVLASRAHRDVFLFVDADVRLAPRAADRIAAFLAQSGAGLVSGVPREETGTFLEMLVIPLIHVTLLGYLPIERMRASTDPAYGAGCGQLFAARRDAYEASTGHAALRDSRHDGVKLPRAFRRAGFATDLFDATDLAACRMYRSAGETWRGFAKNATEGMATWGGLVPWTVLLLGGHVLPVVLLAAGIAGKLSHASTILAALATAMSYAGRAACAVRFKGSYLGVAFHPVGVAVLVAIQWWARCCAVFGLRTAWKGRAA